MHMVDFHASHSSVLDSEINLVMHCCNRTCNIQLIVPNLVYWINFPSFVSCEQVIYINLKVLLA